MFADFPRLTSEGHERRVRAVMAGRGKGPVALASIIKKFIRNHHPDFTFRASAGDYHIFEKALSPNLKIILIFERIHHFGLGKAFTLHLGCECIVAGEQLRWKHSLFPFFEREGLEWTYGLRDELEACLNETATLLDFVLSDYEAAWLSLCRDDSIELLHDLPLHGSLSFNEACGVAETALASICPQFQLVDGAFFRRENSPLSYFGFRPQTDADAQSGRLTPDHSWHIRFADIGAKRTVTVSVPFS